MRRSMFVARRRISAFAARADGCLHQLKAPARCLSLDSCPRVRNIASDDLPAGVTALAFSEGMIGGVRFVTVPALAKMPVLR